MGAVLEPGLADMPGLFGSGDVLPGEVMIEPFGLFDGLVMSDVPAGEPGGLGPGMFAGSLPAGVVGIVELVCESWLHAAALAASANESRSDL